MLGKNRRKKVRKTFFYIHTNIVTKKWGEQNVRNNFSSKTLIVRSKNVRKKIVGKIGKTFFYIPTNIVTKKWGGKNGRNNFSRNTLIVRAKNVGKKIVGKKCEKRFLYSHKCRYQKMLGKKRA